MAKARIYTVTGTVESIDHAGTSHNGNPTYRVTLTDSRSFLTLTDGSIGYAATNFRPHSTREPIVRVTLTINGRMRITDITRA